MSDKPIIPSRIIPAGAPLPAQPPDDDDIPPWRPARRSPPPAPPAPPAPPPPPPPPPPPVNPWHGPGAYGPPGPIEVRVSFVPMVIPPELTRRQRLWAWLRTYATPLQTLTGLTLAVAPILPGGNSFAGTWLYTVGEARGFGAGWAYALGGGALALAGFGIARKRDQRREGRGSSGARIFFFAVTFVGAFGAINLYDPVTWITGVHQ